LRIADETRPGRILKKIVYGFIRIRLVAITYLIPQTTTHAVKDVQEKAEEAGFEVESVRARVLRSVMERHARKP
jgi:hypothetical protein